MTFRGRLLVSYLLLASIVLVVLEVPLGVVGARREHDGLRAQASRDATSLAVLAGEDIGQAHRAALDRLARKYKQQTQAEVLIVDTRGAPVISLTPSEREGSADLTAETASALRDHTSVATRNDEGKAVETAAVPVSDEHRSTVGAVVVSIPAGAVKHRVRVLVAELLAVAALAMAAVVALGWYLSRSVTRPFVRLETASRLLGEGDLAIRVSEDGPPEVRSQARAFNRMAARLSELMDAQRRFVADASHQLRSPLTALRLRLENVDPDNRVTARRNLEQAGAEVARLSRVVDGLLALARVEGSRPARQAVDVNRVVADRAGMWAPFAEERDVELVVDAHRPGLRALVVPDHLEQILDCLLANAFEATPPNSRVSMHTDLIGETVEIRVTDEGPGMTEAERSAAFGRFWQGTGTVTGTTGLGLPIALQLARTGGGDLTLHARAGGGLEAHLTLDAAPAASAREG